MKPGRTSCNREPARLLSAAALMVCLAGLAHGSPQREPDLKTVLRRAGDYIGVYHDRLSEIVAEEHYVQRTLRSPSSGIRLRADPTERSERELKSDFMLLRGYADENLWIGVREVFEIDGQPAEEERGRLRALLTDTRTPIATRLKALANQQAKYNLGDLYRTINTPTVALQFLRPDLGDRIGYRRAGTETFRGTPVWKVTFKERRRPTLVRTPDGRDVRSTGAFWIDPRDGAVLRTELRAGDNRSRRFTSFILVSYQRHPRFDMLLPDDMNELYELGATRIEGHATYSNFRRFETETRIKH